MDTSRHTPEQAVTSASSCPSFNSRSPSRLPAAAFGDHPVDVQPVAGAVFSTWRSSAASPHQPSSRHQRLKKLLAEQALGIDMLKELAEETFDPGT